MQRTYLFVPPEEYSEVRALGARWDSDSKCWYIEADEASDQFSEWLPNAEPDEESFSIASTEAYVAATTTSCQRCRSRIEVICIYCESGGVLGDPVAQFTVSGVSAMDEALAQQLKPWSNFYKLADADGEGNYFANHCSHCGVRQDDMYLHSEPDQPFFDITRTAPGSIKLTPLAGTIRLSGNEHFVVE